MKKILTLFAVVTLFSTGGAHSEQIRYICSGTHVDYDGWGKRTEQMSSLKEDPVDLVIDTEAKKVSFSTKYAGPVTTDLKISDQWYEGEAAVNVTVMNRKVAQVSVKLGRIAWQAMTIYTLDDANGETHLAYAGVCTPSAVK
ncbi:MAG: hypothetical protein RI960_1328 [Pseudomonadota bacterium]|jgi:hypothetical protein